MVGLHVLHDKVVGLAVSECFLEIVQPLMREASVNRIHYGNLLVHDDIGIVCHSVWNNVLAFEQVNFVVVDSDVDDILCDFHF